MIYMLKYICGILNGKITVLTCNDSYGVAKGHMDLGEF